MWLWAAILSTFLALSLAQDDGNYMVIVPCVVRPGSSLNLNVQIRRSNGPVTVVATLYDQQYNVLKSASDVFDSGSRGWLEIEKLDQIPPGMSAYNKHLYLAVNGTGGLTFGQLKKIPFESKSASIFVQTDKAMYKPGQLVKLRVFAVYPDLVPHPGPFDIEIYDNQGNKIKKWDGANGDVPYIVSRELQLSEDPPLGDYRIKVKLGSNTYEKTFEVAEYVLPKFEVSVEFERSYQMTVYGDIHFKVNAKYTFGKDVKGKCSVKLTTSSYRTSGRSWMSTKDLENGEAEFVVTLSEITAMFEETRWGSDPLEELSNGYTSITVNADCTEAGTGTVLSGEKKTDFKRNSLELAWMGSTPDTFKPGLDFVAYLQVTQPDGSPPTQKQLNTTEGAPVKLTMTIRTEFRRTISSGVTETGNREQNLEFDISPQGIVIAKIPVDETVDSMTLTPKVHDRLIASSVQFDSYVYATSDRSKTVQKFKSRDELGIQISLDNLDAIIKPSDMTFLVKTTTPISGFYFVMMAKGEIISANYISVPNVKEYSWTETISESLAAQLAPSARLVVYFYSLTGEIIVDTMDVNVDESSAFANKVTLRFDQEQVSPADDVELTVEAKPDSAVGILVVDTSVNLLKSGNDIESSMVIDELRTYDSSSKNKYIYPIDPRGVIGGPMFDGRRKKRSIMPCYYWRCFPVFTGGKDAKEMFENAGICIYTDAYVHDEPEPQFFPSPWYPEFAVRGGVAERGPPMMAAPAGQAGPSGPTMFPAPPAPAPPPAPGPPTADDNLATPQRTRTLFPETWIWVDSNTRADGTVNLRAQAPDTITSWVASAFALHPTYGLGISDEKAEVRVFKPFFIQVTMPYSLIRHEEFKLQVTVFNYQSTSQKVMLTLKQSNKFGVIKSVNAIEPVNEEDIRTVTIEANGQATLSFWIVATHLGLIPIELTAQSSQAADAVRRMLLVEPNGTPEEDTWGIMVPVRPGETFSHIFDDIQLPSNLVQDSQNMKVTVIGDVMGTLVNNLGKLIKKPYGCGEQNMINFVPNIIVMKYLTTTGLGSQQDRDKATTFMTQGYQRELNYKRNDGSYSAFGMSDSHGSTWLTAFVVRSFYQARDFITIDEDMIIQGLHFIKARMQSDGSFEELHQVHHAGLRGGVDSGPPLVAYMVITLHETQDLNSKDPSLNLPYVLNTATTYLENKYSSITDTYSLAIVTYAFSLVNSRMFQSAYTKLMEEMKSEGDFRFWAEERKVECDDYCWRQPRSHDIEMTGYALKSVLLQNDMSNAIPIIKWLVSKQNPQGGYASTQDTVVGLQALTAFASQTYGDAGSDRNLEISLSINGRMVHTYEPITANNPLLLQSYEFDQGTSVSFRATGSGTAFVQLSVTYHVEESSLDSGIDLEVQSDYINDNQVDVSVCVQWTNAEQASGMANIEMLSLSGFDWGGVNDLLNRHRDEGLNKVETKDNKLVTYWNEFKNDTKTCITVSEFLTTEVANLQGSQIKAFSYYRPENVVSHMYAAPAALTENKPTRCEQCPECCKFTGTTTTTTRSWLPGGASGIIPAWTLVLLLLSVFLI